MSAATMSDPDQLGRFLGFPLLEPIEGAGPPFCGVDWFAFEDLDGEQTIGGWFDDGMIWFRPGQPVGFSEDPIAVVHPPFRNLAWSTLPAHSLIEAAVLGRCVANRERRVYERGETGKKGAGGRPSKIDRARAWMEKQPRSIANNDGDRALARIAVTLVRGFCLAPMTDAMRLLEAYNAHAEPPWSQEKLERVAEWAERNGRMQYGAMLDQSPNRGRGPGRGGHA
jgi:hypothetical protein